MPINVLKEMITKQYVDDEIEISIPFDSDVEFWATQYQHYKEELKAIIAKGGNVEQKEWHLNM
jgi:hypothetical protein